MLTSTLLRSARRAGSGLLLAVALAACGSPPSTPKVASAGGTTTTIAAKNGSPDQDFEDAALAFAKCLREHGVDVADPEPGGPLTITAGGAGPGSGPLDDGKVQAAQEACKDLAPKGGKAPSAAEQKEQQDAALAFAKCMREHGVDVPDPEFTDDGGIKMQINAGQGDTAKAQEAQAACESLNPIKGAKTAGGPGGPGGPGPSGNGGAVSSGSLSVHP